MKFFGGKAKNKRSGTNPLLNHLHREKQDRQKFEGKAEGYVDGYRPDEEEAEFLGLLAQRYDPSAKPMRHFGLHRAWYEAIAFYCGLQWVKWEAEGGRLESKKAPPWKVLLTVNRILSMVLRTVSKLDSQQVDFGAVPVTSDAEDKNGAKLALKFLEHGKRVSKFEKARSLAVFWSVVVGTGFIKMVWNPEAGPRVKSVDSEGKRKDEGPAGEIEAHFVTPFAIRQPFICTDIDECPWIVLHHRKPIEWIFQNYPEKAKYVVGGSGAGIESQYEDRLRGMVGPEFGIMSEAQDDDEQTVEVIEIYARPCLGHPKGFQGIATGCGVVLNYNRDNPYYEISPSLAIPIARYRYAPRPMNFWGMGLVEQLQPMQREYNIARSQIVENKDLMSRPKWTAPKGHGLPKTAINSMPGEVIEYNPQLPRPEQVQTAALPNYVVEHIHQLVAEMQDVGAQQDVSQAKAPAQVRSGVAISLLQESDNAVLAVPKKDYNRADLEACQFMLELAQAKYSVRRAIAVLGKETKEFELVDFVGADIRGATTLYITREDGLYESKATKRETIMDLLQLGAFDPADPSQREELLRALDLGDIDSFIHERMLDSEQADRENQTFLKAFEAGADPAQVEFRAPEEWEDHLTHIRRHNMLRKSSRWDELDEQSKLRMNMHVQVHQQFVQMQMAAQQSQDESKKGMPGEKGNPSPPKSGASGQAAEKGQK